MFRITLVPSGVEPGHSDSKPGVVTTTPPPHTMYNDPVLCLVPSSAAISCLPQVFVMLNTTETTVGTEVNATCPAGRKLTTGQLTMSSTCNRRGEWSPNIPQCTGRYEFLSARLDENCLGVNSLTYLFTHECPSTYLHE